MICKTCGDDKPDTNFSKRTGGRSRNLHCRKCIKENRNKRGLCRCGKPQKSKSTRCQDCLDKHKLNVARRRLHDKTIVLAAYGGKCRYCGESRSIFLTIDHIHNNGAAHRREIGKGSHIYRWLRQQNFSPDYQVACYNCNCAKNIIGEELLLSVLQKHDADS